MTTQSQIVLRPCTSLGGVVGHAVREGEEYALCGVGAHQVGRARNVDCLECVAEIARFCRGPVTVIFRGQMGGEIVLHATAASATAESVSVDTARVSFLGHDDALDRLHRRARERGGWVEVYLGAVCRVRYHEPGRCGAVEAEVQTKADARHVELGARTALSLVAADVLGELERSEA